MADTNPPAEGTPAGEEPEITLVTLAFDAASPEAADRLLAVLAKYVVVSRQESGCRNIDLCQSVTTEGRFVVIEKWDSPESQRTHFDSAEMVDMAKSCEGLLAQKPEIDLLEGLSAYDLH